MTSTSKPTTSQAPEHLNSTGCVIKSTPDKGRGVYAARLIPRSTVVEISPVLLFSKEEYENHGRHTVLDHYTFTWTDGRMALALGLGSLFNHSSSPSVSYSLDTKTDSIRYTTVRDVEAGEELCIFYGHKLWFSPADRNYTQIEEIEVEDGWGGLAADVQITNPYEEGDQTEVIPENELPFVRLKQSPDEEDPESIRTIQAWVVDVPDPRHITTLLKWLKQVGLDGLELSHLKRIRKTRDTSSLLLGTTSELPPLPANLDLPAPYMLPVPASSALTMPSLDLKSALWPTMYTPKRKDEPEPWTRGKLRWAWDVMKRTVDAAITAQTESDELPIAAHIPAPDDPSGAKDISFVSCDTRRTTQHPLRHAAINVVRQLADYRASQATGLALPPFEASEEAPLEVGEARNGSNYLLTNRHLFITHEPCIMCSMALLHSRVKEVVYLYPMPQTGGCGGLEGRYRIRKFLVESFRSEFMVDA
ncbi:hypothetical protein NLJ89_g7617 [Agrocybe chaxingu]|uniref:Uncharacterized protein n=1 Tax=Agrocybe chaxingu TaxID=84603 RepID=A0A9W8JWA3_9AGAR|nr:hypothetical protein NLJ89_g7617 [Agrocybe chaxingu]